ncbi:MAG: permease-like cell division protein FtsX [Rikenellaceae bacterium]|nr:permease-like cell division protein FtsX [Rikenellaceae bacterium]MDE7355407.1 permease-like cell division protein FtsX [Rikenellaceae bacterium]
MATDNRSSRSAYYISTLSVSMILFLLGIIAYGAVNIAKASGQLMDDMCINVLLKDGLSDNQIKTLQERIASTSGVGRVEYISKEDAAAEFRAFAGEDLRVFLDDNPLPASFEVHLKDRYENTVKPERTAELLGKFDGVAEVLYKQDVLEHVSGNIYKVRIIAVSFMLALLVLSIILIANTIRMVVHTKRFLIKTMRLVGATDKFIRTPFIRDAFYQGLSAGVTAWVLLSAVVMGIGYFSPNMPFTEDDLMMLAVIYGAIMVTGVAICMVSTSVTLQRYLNIDNNSLYIY